MKSFAKLVTRLGIIALHPQMIPLTLTRILIWPQMSMQLDWADFGSHLIDTLPLYPPLMESSSRTSYGAAGTPQMRTRSPEETLPDESFAQKELHVLFSPRSSG